MGRPKGKKKVMTHVRKKTNVCENSSAVLNTLLQCSFVQAHLSGHSLKITLKVEPEKCGSHHQVFNAFVRGEITCRTISAEILPEEMCESCDVCGGMSPRQETVLNFTVVASDLKSDCNICHDHGSLSKYKNCANDSSKHNACTEDLEEEPEAKGNKHFLKESIEDAEARLREKTATKETRMKGTKAKTSAKELSEDFERYSDSEHDDDHDEDFRLEDEEDEDDVTEEEADVDLGGIKRTRSVVSFQKRRKGNSLDSKKKTYTCKTCGQQKKYAKGKCTLCPNMTKHHECKYCEKTFQSALMLDEHRQTHDPDRPYLCPVCGAAFARRHNMTRHKKNHKGMKDFKCDVCDKRYVELSQLKIHSRVHTGERPYQCDTCGKSFISSSSLRTHAKFHDKKMFQCDLCDKTFFSKSYLIYHQSVHTGQQPFVCSVCGKGCFTKFHLKRHMWTHNRVRSYKCEECPKIFYSPSELKVHCRVHTGERPFKCSVCEKTFTMGSSLNKHLRSHSVVKPYRCEVCEKDFVTQLQYHCHMKIHKEKKFICEICGKRFYNASGLKSHDITHKGIKKNTCDKCGKSYRSAWYLKIHKKTHTGENLIQCHTCGDWFTDPSYFKLHQRKYCKGNPVYCEVCGQAFPHNRALTSHMGLHTGERPFGCEVCGRAFAKPESLSEHVKRHSDNTSFRCNVCGKYFINTNELRKHEVRHTKVKMKSSLPESMKPGNRKSSAALAVSESSTSVEVDSFCTEERQASQVQETRQMPHVHAYPELDSCEEDLEQMLQPVDLRPVGPYIEKGNVSNMAQDHESPLHANPWSSHGDVVYTRSLPHAHQTPNMVPPQGNHRGHHSVVMGRDGEEI